jgi:5-bromo-4-chloroindolyl phosphate hydrolysis protein
MERGSQMNPFINRMLKLLTVKSIVTLILTLVFACLALQGSIDQDFMTIYAVIISFYFGTQSQEVKSAGEGGQK